MGGRFTTVIVCNLYHDSERERFLQSILWNYVRTPWVASVDYNEASSIRERFHPYLVLVDLGQNPEQAMAAIPIVKKAGLQYVIVIGSSESRDIVPRIVALGVTDILPGDDIPSELEAAVEKIWKSQNKTIA